MIIAVLALFHSATCCFAALCCWLRRVSIVFVTGSWFLVALFVFCSFVIVDNMLINVTADS